MRIVAQRVSRAAVSVDGRGVASIGRGLLLLVGVAHGDTPERARAAADKVANLRVFSDSEGLMNLSLLDVGGETLVVSQFTLLADARRGRRPSFVAAAPPDDAEPVVEGFAAALRAAGVPTGQGLFGARMEVELVNDGPVTLVLDFD